MKSFTMHIIYCKTEHEGKEKAVDALNGRLEEVERKPLLLLLSGGSALALLDGIKEELLGEHITISVLDERWSNNPTVNNFAQITNTQFYKRAVKAGARFIDTRVGENESLEAMSSRFENALREWKKQNPQGRVIATQGIGEDGHTAGIMPYPENPALFTKLFEDADHWVAGYDAKEKNPYPLRVTVTTPFLRECVDASIAYVVGNEKQQVVTRVKADEGSLWETPARVLREMREVRLITNVKP